MQNQGLASCNRLTSPLCSSSFCGRRQFLKRALWAQHPGQRVSSRSPSHSCTRCLVATGGSDDEDDEPKQQHTPSSRNQSQPSASGLGLNPDLEQPVPTEQRPVNELAALRETWLYSWARLETPSYLSRLGAVWLGFFALVAGPIAFQTFDPSKQPAEWMMSGTLGALAVVAAAVVRIYLGWAYVGNRLLSAAVEYEETGWYDGQTFVKPPEVLARDRLLGAYEVKPILARLKTTLAGSTAALVLSAGLLVGLVQAGTDSDGIYGRGAARAPRQVTLNGIIYSDKVKSLADLRDDEDAAAAEALAQGGRPGYCGDRYFKAAAGGHMCDHFDRHS
ncbi:hypothetical protein WJX79_009289 [Trebouxia sp. C0005]|nr:MAG: DUF1230-domain-containing protein [Trebouxia sp. A1-2]